jgi:hypothetical protein
MRVINTRIQTRTSQIAWELLVSMDPLGQLLEQLPHPNMQQVQEKFHAYILLQRILLNASWKTRSHLPRVEMIVYVEQAAPAPESRCYSPPHLGVSTK